MGGNGIYHAEAAFDQRTSCICQPVLTRAIAMLELPPIYTYVYMLGRENSENGNDDRTDGTMRSGMIIITGAAARITKAKLL